MDGQWRTSVDDRWRLTIPNALAKEVGDKVLIYQNGNGYVKVEKLPKKIEEEHRPYICKVKIKSGPTNIKRVLIPYSLRCSRSFSVGRKLIAAGKGRYMELWPRENS
ncbi:MAG: hypothetical protein ACQESA_02445 [Patescibacteria group bacterium]